MYVVDTNILIAVASGEDRGALFADIVEGDNRIIGSEMTLAEAPHIIRKYVKEGYIDERAGHEWLRKIQTSVDEFYPIAPDAMEVLHESLRLNHSAYDMFNFVLARRYRACMVSFDKTLIKLCVQEGLDVCTEVNF